MPGVARWLRSIQYVPTRALASQRRSPGRNWTQGIRIEDLRLDNMPARVKKLGDLWAGLLSPEKRARLETLYHAAD